MTDDLRASFITYYIESLGERTREEKNGTKFGFDWVIYNLALSEEWIPHRLPFIRTGPDTTSKTKTEPEFGVDLAFISGDRKRLRIFVLKDEVLNNKNWTKHDFDTDIRNASAPDLKDALLSEVTSVEVVLAYNKDEDRTGVELYERRVANQGTTIGAGISLRFDRWNLSAIVNKVKEQLLSPALMPQKFFSQFSYICSQFADFRHGSDEWCNQLVPNWRNFVSTLLSDRVDERSVRLLPVALIVLQAYGERNGNTETGWIDLMEWGMLAAWNVCRGSERGLDELKRAVVQMWISMYLRELDRYYKSHALDLAVQYSLDQRSSGSLVDTIATGVIAHWHLARIGILSVGYSEMLGDHTEEEKYARFAAINEVANWQAGFLIANPSAMRPILDIQHIQLFLTWIVFWQAGRADDIYNWLLMLVNRLSMRRSDSAQIPFIEGRNSIELVFEHVATGDKPPEFCDGSSVYLLCLLELMCSLPQAQRNALLELCYRRLVLGNDDFGSQMEGCQPIDLMIWFPPADWQERVLLKSLASDGDCATVHFQRLGKPELSTGSELAEEINGFVAQSRQKREFVYPKRLPLSVVVLACLKHQTPLPPEIWRSLIFVSDQEKA